MVETVTESAGKVNNNREAFRGLPRVLSGESGSA